MKVSEKRKAIIFATYTLTDPPTINTINSLLTEGWNVVVVQQSFDYADNPFGSKINFINLNDFRRLKFPAFICSIFGWVYYKIKILKILGTERPDMIVSFMFRPIAAIPKKYLNKTISCIYDIPPVKFIGRLDRYIVSIAWKKLKYCKLIWASDEYKAVLVKSYADLSKLPIICHNCPPLNYFSNLNKAEQRKWLVDFLKKKKLSVSDDTIILLRAGAIGEYGGIEETLGALQKAKTNIVFILMGRPTDHYLLNLKKLIKKLNLINNVVVLNRPDDDLWKKILISADIGHLIHVEPKDQGYHSENFKLNSSLSNNRLYQYLSAGLPIISYNDERMALLYQEINSFFRVKQSNMEESLIQLFKYEFKDKTRLNKYSLNALKAFSKKYNWEFQFFPIFNLIDEIK